VSLRKNAKIELLRRTPPFSSCSKRELAEIAAIADEIDIPDGKAFIREGERRPGVLRRNRGESTSARRAAA
jgi:hypothetical protein